MDRRNRIIPQHHADGVATTETAQEKERVD